MTGHDTALDLSVLESLDFPVECGHSQHNSNEFTHDGSAAFIAVSYHQCPGRQECPPPYYYPCCATWAAFVQLNRQMDRHIICGHCGAYGRWVDFVEIIDDL